MEVLVPYFSWRVSWMLLCAAPYCGVSFGCEDIPVYTGQIHNRHSKIIASLVHPRAYGADEKKAHNLSDWHGFIPVYTGQILNAPRKSLPLMTSCFHLIVPWRNQYASSFRNVFLRITLLAIFDVFHKKEMPMAPLLLCFHIMIFFFCLYSSKASLDQCVNPSCVRV